MKKKSSLNTTTKGKHMSFQRANKGIFDRGSVNQKINSYTILNPSMIFQRDIILKTISTNLTSKTFQFGSPIITKATKFQKN
jgi:hypothetical protein